MGEAQWTAARDMLEAVYTAKDGGRKMSEIFQELPDKEEYADYYEAIPEPECLDNIAVSWALRCCRGKLTADTLDRQRLCIPRSLLQAAASRLFKRQALQ